MTIRGKEIQVAPTIANLLISSELRAVVAVGFFLAYLATAIAS